MRQMASNIQFTKIRFGLLAVIIWMSFGLWVSVSWADLAPPPSKKMTGWLYLQKGNQPYNQPAKVVLFCDGKKKFQQDTKGKKPVHVWTLSGQYTGYGFAFSTKFPHNSAILASCGAKGTLVDGTTFALQKSVALAQQLAECAGAVIRIPSTTPKYCHFGLDLDKARLFAPKVKKNKPSSKVLSAQQASQTVQLPNFSPMYFLGFAFVLGANLLILLIGILWLLRGSDIRVWKRPFAAFAVLLFMLPIHWFLFGVFWQSPSSFTWTFAIVFWVILGLQSLICRRILGLTNTKVGALFLSLYCLSLPFLYLFLSSGFQQFIRNVRL